MAHVPVPTPSSYWLIERRFLAGEYPGAAVAARAREKLGQFLDAGIRSFIDLTEERDALEPYKAPLFALARERGVDVAYRRFGIRDLGCPSHDLMAQILDALAADIAANRAVYVHCWGGVGRTGTVVGCWLVEQGMTGDAALEAIERRRRRIPDRRTSPETPEQHAFVRSWQPRRNSETRS